MTRGRPGLFWPAFALVAVSGGAILVAVRTFFESLTPLWVSMGARSPPGSSACSPPRCRGGRASEEGVRVRGRGAPRRRVHERGSRRAVRRTPRCRSPRSPRTAPPRLPRRSRISACRPTSAIPNRSPRDRFRRRSRTWSGRSRRPVACDSCTPPRFDPISDAETGSASSRSPSTPTTRASSTTDGRWRGGRWRDPADADLRQAYRAFLTGQVIGFYDPETGRARLPRSRRGPQPRRADRPRARVDRTRSTTSISTSCGWTGSRPSARMSGSVRRSASWRATRSTSRRR